ncbi:atr [Trichonephila clavipes]|uniref:Atr n=1 Tax=Trichonephila clavipes TaxID=2585209 RepID=A0A8X6WE25_TRICX|nr:atr [Trichonephila clavipes]
MMSAGMRDQPVNKKDLMQERFEALLHKHRTKKNGAALIREKLLTLLAEVKSAVVGIPVPEVHRERGNARFVLAVVRENIGEGLFQLGTRDG